MQPARPLRAVDVLRDWIPLALSWLLMAVEDPFVVGAVTKLPDSTAQLAGHGGAFVSAGDSDRDAHHHVARGQHEIVHRSGGVPPVVVFQPCFGGGLHNGARRGGLHSTL